jgi:GT2 family glycosyltransferase
MPRVSIVIPIHDMKEGADFLWNSINKLTEQTFQDFEIVITKEGKMAENTNAGIRRARGELIKILYLDDCLTDKWSLEEMVHNFTHNVNWMIVGTSTNPHPYWTPDIVTGNNKLGSPSALMFRNEQPLLFDENMSWLLDCDYYHRLYERYGEPYILDAVNVTMGIGDHQMTNILSDEEKENEFNYISNKYA